MNTPPLIPSLPSDPDATSAPASTDPGRVLSWSEINLVKRHPSILDPRRSVLVVIDMQEKLLAGMRDLDPVIAATRRLIAGATVLGVPILVTEQYRKGLGPTDPRLMTLLDRALFFEKLSFSAVGDKDFLAKLVELKPSHVAIAGVETHVCVAQTALDLEVRGYRVSVASDAVASRRTADRDTALARLGRSGITVSTSEALIMELTEQAGTETFRKVLQIIK